MGGGPARLNVTESGKGYLCKTIQASSRPSHRGQRRGEIARQIDADARARFLIAAFHGLVLQSEWDERLSIKPLLGIFDVLLVAATSTPSLAKLPISNGASRLVFTNAGGSTWTKNQLSGKVKPNCLQSRVFGNLPTELTENPVYRDLGLLLVALIAILIPGVLE